MMFKWPDWDTIYDHLWVMTAALAIVMTATLAIIFTLLTCDWLIS